MKKSFGKSLFVIALVLVAILSMCGCESKANLSSSNNVDSGYGYEMQLASQPKAFNGAADTEYGGLAASRYDVESEAAYDSVTVAAEGSIFNSVESSDSGGGNVTGEDSTESDINPEKIIYSANVTVETTDFDTTIETINTMIERYGGWVESSSVNGANYSSLSHGGKMNRSANYTIRVSSPDFDSVMSELPTLGNVPSSNVYTDNITSEYYDTEARLESYEAQEKRLVELLDKAESVSDVIEIENELANVRYRIESLQTSLRGWDRKVAWSTITLRVSEVYEYTPQTERSFTEKLKASFEYGIDELSELVLVIVEVLPSLLIIFVLALLAIIVAIALIRKIAFKNGRKGSGNKSTRGKNREAEVLRKDAEQENINQEVTNS